MRQIVLAITGASGACYARRLAQCLVAGDVHVHLVASAYGRQLLADELGLAKLTPEGLVGRPVENMTAYAPANLAAQIASGSFRTHGMVVCPCSSNTLAQVAAGTSDNLITRAAQVTLKEARRLIVVHREMPLSQMDIANMLKISQAGGIICPANPGFYLHPSSIDDLVDFVVGRVLDLLDLSHDLPVRWDPDKPSEPSDDALGS